MSLLDRIGKQAQRVREERAAAEREKQRLEDRYEQIVAPAMEGLHDYLQALSRDLGEVQPPVQLHYQLIHYGPIVANALHEYRIEKHKRRFGYEITMAWRARVDHEKSNEQRIHGHRRVKQLIDQLRQLHLGGVREAEHGPNGDLIEARIHPRGFLHLELTAKASAYDTYLRLSFRHLDSLGQTHKHVVAEQLDASFYDRLGRFLIREDDELIKEQLSPELRARLQDAVGSSEPLTMLSETVLDPLAPSDEPFEVVEDDDAVAIMGEPDASADSESVSADDAATTPLTQRSVLTEEPLDRSFSHLADKDRELLLQASLKALAPAETVVEDLTDDRQLKAAAFVLRMKLMADQLRDKD
ncbi:MAG: hypothetical protein KDI56_06630 [Xanthomonadales bacterium]|nr:hypothetical protein [Xanthomonadales bacterium]